MQRLLRKIQTPVACFLLGMLAMFVINKWRFTAPSNTAGWDNDNSVRAFERIDRTGSSAQLSDSVKVLLKEEKIETVKDDTESPSSPFRHQGHSPLQETGKLTAAKEIQRLLNQPDMKTRFHHHDERRQQSSDSKNGRCIKTLHIFAIIGRMKFVPAMKHFLKLLNSSHGMNRAVEVDCISLGYECDLKLSVGATVESARGKDAVIFGTMSLTWIRKEDMLNAILEQGPEPGQTWIFYSTEPPHRVVKGLDTVDIPSIKYHVLMTYRSDSDIRVPFGYFRPFKGSTDGPKDTRFWDDEFYTNRTGLISWVATNCKNVFWPRIPLIEKLKRLMPFDTYGRCGTEECLPRRSEACNQLFASYKFYLAVPNAECEDYITEKFWMMSLLYGAVPVVLGAPKENYARVAPPNSYVHAGDFPNFSALAQYLKQVDKDDNLYRKYHEWRNQGEVVTTFPYKPSTMCRTLPHIFEREPNEFKYLGDSPWFRGCRHIANKTFVKQSFMNLGNWAVW